LHAIDETWRFATGDRTLLSGGLKERRSSQSTWSPAGREKARANGKSSLADAVREFLRMGGKFSERGEAGMWVNGYARAMRAGSN
jgi:hypothetical protein